MKWTVKREKFTGFKPPCWFWMCLPAGSCCHHVLLCIIGRQVEKTVVFNGVSPPTRDFPLIRRKLQCDLKSLGNAPKVRFHLKLFSFVINTYDGDHGYFNSTPQMAASHMVLVTPRKHHDMHGFCIGKQGRWWRGNCLRTISKLGLCLGKEMHTNVPSHHHSSPQTNMRYNN